MMDRKKLVNVKAEVVALLNRLPGRSPRKWLAKEMEAAKNDPRRDFATLEVLCAALESEAVAKGTIHTTGTRSPRGRVRRTRSRSSQSDQSK
jgi:hypothetical protein